MPHYLTGSVIDYSGEKSAFRIPTGAITAVSIAGALSGMGAVNSAIDNIILGDRNKEGWVGDETTLSSQPSTNPMAQVELAWLVTYRGTTSNKLFQVTIGTADPGNGHLLANTDQADLANADMAAFVTAFEALARTPDSDTETVEVVRINLVGRNR